MNEQRISGIIYYPADFHALLTEYAKSQRFLAGARNTPRVQDIYFDIFQRSGGMELLKTEVAALKEQIEEIKRQPKVEKRPGRPRKRKS